MVCYFLIKPSNFGLTLTYITESNPFKRVNKLKSFQGQITKEQIIRELRWPESVFNVMVVTLWWRNPFSAYYFLPIMFPTEQDYEVAQQGKRPAAWATSLTRR